jgi:hypothetical protein
MNNPPGKLVLIAGLPGSGKSCWMKINTPAADFFVADDFMAHALGDIGRFTYSRWYFPLVFALRAGRNAAISDIAFCDIERQREAQRVMTDAVNDLEFEWVFFEYVPDACRQNIERDAREKGRLPEKRLQALKEWSPRYNVPPGVPTQLVYRVPNQQERILGSRLFGLLPKRDFC